MMSEKSESSLNDSFATWILALATIGLIIAGIAAVGTSCFNSPKVQRVELSYVPADSGTVDLSTQTIVIPKADLDSIIAKLEHHEVQLNQKYQHILQKREDEDSYRTIFMLVFGIVVSVLGFFGFRSFEDISRKAIATAEEVAQNRADITIQEYLKSNLQKLVNDRIKDLYEGEGRQSIIEELRTVFIESINESLTKDPGKAFIDSAIQDVLDLSLEDRADAVIKEKLDQLNLIPDEPSGDTEPEGDSESEEESEDDSNPDGMF